MTNHAEPEHFINWQRALAENTLTPEQKKTLQDMVDSGQVDSVETAAKMLDWQDGVIDPGEHMWGF
jgi:hypothetical protein